MIKKEKNYFHYLRWLAAIFVINLSLFAGLNFTVDPYGIWSLKSIDGFNHIKPAQNNHVKLFKAIQVKLLKPKIILMGSSRAEFGLDPNHPALGEGLSYNLGLTGTNMYEVMRYFQHAVKLQPDLKEVIIGIDFLMFNEFNENTPDFRENRLENSSIIFADALDTLLTYSAVSNSIENLEASRKEPEKVGYFYSNGMRNAEYYILHQYQNKSFDIIFKSIIQRFLTTPYLYQNYQLSDRYLENLKTLVKICTENQIKMSIFISPAHAIQWETIRLAGLWSIFEQWKREVVKITPVWDFSGYNSITTEALGKDMKNYIESSHYRKAVGDLVIDRIYQKNTTQIPQDFGILISPENIESHLETIIRDRNKWANNNPDTVEFVKNAIP